MTALHTNGSTDAVTVPDDQREDLLACYYRDVGHALDWAQASDDKAQQLARVRYLIESAKRLEQAISAYATDPA